MPKSNLSQDYFASSSSSNIIDPHEFLAVLKRRRITALAVFTTIMSIATLLAATAKPTYESSMTLLVSSLYQRTNPNPFTDDSVEGGFVDPNLRVDYTAQLNLMRSSRLIQKAVEQLKSEYPDITERDIIGEEGKAGPLKIEQLLAGTGTNKTPSQVFSINYVANDSVKAQKVLKALQKVYFDYNIEEQNERLRRGLSFINKQLPEVESKVAQAQDNLRKFRAENNLVDPEFQSKLLLESLTTVENARRTNNVNMQALQARYAYLQQRIAQSPEQAYVAGRLSQSGRYQELLNRLQKTEYELAKSKVTYTDDNPKVKKLLEERQSLFDLIRQEAGRVLNTEVQSQSGEALLNQGQFGKIELGLVDELINAQKEGAGLLASERKLVEQEQQIRSQISKYPSLLAQFSRLKPETEVNQKTLEQLLKAQQSLALQIAQGGFNWETIQDPKPGASLGSGRIMLFVLGLLAGVMLAIVAALLQEVLDDKIYNTNELLKLIPAPLLGRIQKLESGLTPVGSRVEHLMQSPMRESFDMVYQQIQRSHINSQVPKSVVIASALPGEGKSTIALGLALSATRVHKRVLLVDADLRRPSLHQTLHLSNEKGLSQCLEATTKLVGSTLQSYVQSPHPGLDVLPAGTGTTNPVGLLSSDALESLIRLAEQEYDLVIADTPPSLGIADAILVSKLCSAIIFVCSIGQISKTELQEAMDTLDVSKLMGVVTNRSEPTSKTDKPYDRTQSVELQTQI